MSALTALLALETAEDQGGNRRLTLSAYPAGALFRLFASQQHHYA